MLDIAPDFSFMVLELSRHCLKCISHCDVGIFMRRIVMFVLVNHEFACRDMGRNVNKVPWTVTLAMIVSPNTDSTTGDVI